MFVILKVILSDVEAPDVADALQKRFFGESSSFEVYLKTSEVRSPWTFIRRRVIYIVIKGFL